MRMLIFLMAVGILFAGCQPQKAPTVTSAKSLMPVGSGSIILRASTADAVANEQISDEVRVFALDTETRLEGYIACPAGETQCSDRFGHVAPAHAARICRQGSKYKCGRFSEAGKIVWEGNVFALNPRPLQAVPFHGTWPVRVTHPNSAGGHLHANRGVLTISSPDIGRNCNLDLRPTGFRNGSFAINCDNGRTIRGTYQRNGNKVLHARVFSSDGYDIRMTISLD